MRKCIFQDKGDKFMLPCIECQSNTYTSTDDITLISIVIMVVSNIIDYVKSSFYRQRRVDFTPLRHIVDNKQLQIDICRQTVKEFYFTFCAPQQNYLQDSLKFLISLT